jgi:hypothetical protein
MFADSLVALEFSSVGNLSERTCRHSNRQDGREGRRFARDSELAPEIIRTVTNAWNEKSAREYHPGSQMRIISDEQDRKAFSGIIAFLIFAREYASSNADR